jgi:hypothetical protein
MPSDGRLAFTPSPQIILYVEQLRRKGFYGKKTGDVLNQLVNNGITQLLKDHLLDPLPADQEGPAEEEGQTGT